MVEDVRNVDLHIQYLLKETVAQFVDRILPKPEREFWPYISSLGNDQVLIQPKGPNKEAQAYSISVFLRTLRVRHEFRGTRTLIVNETDFIKVFN